MRIRLRSRETTLKEGLEGSASCLGLLGQNRSVIGHGRWSSAPGGGFSRAVRGQPWTPAAYGKLFQQQSAVEWPRRRGFTQRGPAILAAGAALYRVRSQLPCSRRERAHRAGCCVLGPPLPPFHVLMSPTTCFTMRLHPYCAGCLSAGDA